MTSAVVRPTTPDEVARLAAERRINAYLQANGCYGPQPPPQHLCGACGEPILPDQPWHEATLPSGPIGWQHVHTICPKENP